MENKIILITNILYNESCYIDEWIDFHFKQGINYIYIYIRYKENINLDLYKKLTEKFKNNKNLFLIHKKWSPFSHIKNFLKNNNKKYKDDWIIFLDIDEFLYSPIENKNIKDIIKIYEEKHIYAIYINWLCYGSNDLINKPKNIIDSFKESSDKFNPINYSIKSLYKMNIINLDLINKINTSHKLPIKQEYDYYNTNFQKINDYNSNKIKNIIKKNRQKYLNLIGKKKEIINYEDITYPTNNPLLIINHYILRSKEEYLLKILNNPHRKDRYNLNNFNNLNKFLKEKYIDES